MKKIKKKYNSISKAAKASFWYTICNVMQKGILLIATPIFTRIMSTGEYGLYTVYQSWYAIFTIFATLNLYASVYNNGLTKFSNEKKVMTSSFLGLSTTITGILFFFYYLKRAYLNHLIGLPTSIMVMMFGQLFFEPATNFWMVDQRYDYKYREVITITLANTLLSTILGIIAVLLSNHKGIMRIITYSSIQACIGFYFYVKQMKEGGSFFSKRYWTYALKFNLPLIPHYLSYSILNQADRIMINYMAGSSKAAMYSVAYTIAMMMQIVTQAITSSLTPYMYKSLKSNRYENLRRSCNVITVFMSLICILVMLFAPEVLRLFASQEYMDAIYVMPPVVASTFFLYLYPLFSNVEFYFEKTRYVMIASSIGALLNIVMNFFSIPRFGYYAAGYTTLICYIMFAVSHYIFYRLVLKHNTENGEEIYDSKIIITTSLLVLLCTFMCTILYKISIIRLIFLIFCMAFMILNHEKIFDLVRWITNDGSPDFGGDNDL